MLTHYTVKYVIDDNHTVLETTCMTEDGYSAPIDFPTMLSVKHFGHTRNASRIRVITYTAK
jgi:hypothetical protein